MSQASRQRQSSQPTKSSMDTLLSWLKQFITLSKAFAWGVSWLIAATSQNIPNISAYGWFGGLLLGVIVFVVLTLTLSAFAYIQRKESGENTKAQWKWTPLLAVVLLVGFGITGLVLIDRRPSLHKGIDASKLTRPIASYAEMEKDTITGRTVVISEVPRDPKHPMRINDKKFVDCVILGPAILTLRAHTTIGNCYFSVPFNNPDSIFFESKSSVLVGTIMLDDCTFEQCTFDLVGFVGSKEQLDKFRANIR